MYPYIKYYIGVWEGDCKERISDLIGGEFSTAEAVNRFMSIHFPDNRAYLPLQKEPSKLIHGIWYEWYSINTDIGMANKLWISYKG